MAQEQEVKDAKASSEEKPNISTVVIEMARSSTALSPPAPSWFTPKRLLVIFCVINLINYVDRGAIASNGVNGSRGTCSKSSTCSSGSGIQGDFDLNNFEDGVLSSAFMVGLLVACPIFASLAKSVNPFRLIGVGLSVWTLAVVGCGCSINFWTITACRMLVGVGEASFMSLAAPFIDDNAPVAKKTLWLGVFYMCIPTGYALGYVYGGVVGGHFNWRFAFFGEAILMLPFAAPVNYVCLHCVKPSLRPLSMAMSTVAIHILGDVPSSPLVGVLQDHINNWRKTALILTLILFPAAVIWFIAFSSAFAFHHGSYCFDALNSIPLQIYVSTISSYFNTLSYFFFGAKFSATKWVQQDNPIFKVRSQGKESFKADPSSPANDSDKEKRFEEALERSCWC
ncbi:unnamed protein product [Dovyalis caffra]|uniref:Major facilitator superfamily (MFS) profile domain-containing protein n=1 Tax=Dovyalis caffra TaxID=77055 RepID=A0AAV1RAX6_9ROSI|nr:unnamed protein product [Dovyalis caffra]